MYGAMAGKLAYDGIMETYDIGCDEYELRSRGAERVLVSEAPRPDALLRQASLRTAPAPHPSRWLTSSRGNQGGRQGNAPSATFRQHALVAAEILCHGLEHFGAR